MALSYAAMKPNDRNSENSLLNFGVLIGTSFENMDGLSVSGVSSDISEIGVAENLPIDHIKFLAVSEDKVEFVKKMVGKKDIEVVSMEMENTFFNNNFSEKLSILEKGKEDIDVLNPIYPTYAKDDVKSVVNTRKTSKIKKIFEDLKEKITSKKRADDKEIDERE